MELLVVEFEASDSKKVNELGSAYSVTRAVVISWHQLLLWGLNQEIQQLVGTHFYWRWEQHPLFKRFRNQ